jgi:uncharacterized lipoprotein YmbA
MRFSLYIKSVFISVIMASMLAGCTTTPPSRFYILDSLPSSGQKKPNLTDPGYISLAIGPVEVSEYLNRPEIVTRISENELKLADFDKWAEPLEHNISRVLAENLTELLLTENFAIFPWGGSIPIDYRIALDILRFDGNLSGDATLVVRWSIFVQEGNKLLTTKKSTYTEPVPLQSFEDLVSAQEKLLVVFSGEIAEEIQSIVSTSKNK